MSGVGFNLARCKEIVDTIYELTRENGYKGPMGGNYYETAIRRILMARGIVKKTGSVRNLKYQWVADMAPTENLYKSVYNAHREIVANYPSQKKRGKPEETPPPPKPHNLPPDAKPVTGNILERFAAQQLWDELKRRGFYADGDKLKQVTILE